MKEWKQGEVVSFVERTELVRDVAVQKESNERNLEIGRVESKESASCLGRKRVS